MANVTNPHNGQFGSVAVTKLAAVSWQPGEGGPRAVLSDDADVQIHQRSAHDVHNGTITMADKLAADILVGQAGPRDFSFDGEEADGITVGQFSFASCSFSRASDTVSLNASSSNQLSFVAKALSFTPAQAHS
jgi:hypothetical protein